ncbi:uncharacterized protein C8Q71DRAFT_778940 [Rhodofomes roseus]|uniref:Secreted protein n=1 Tax=Rhodofomes roseus TaxID=34475 RepID=A0ABQ8K5W8_9APHY|nr:uncharacterized protein C8Q71DRAFT_778940 [Rhodofomes roseus]KAH9831980.1 hypothetical protein C8Q71DRAFT_778940 [Rhodofomes roseus]
MILGISLVVLECLGLCLGPSLSLLSTLATTSRSAKFHLGALVPSENTTGLLQRAHPRFKLPRRTSRKCAARSRNGRLRRRRLGESRIARTSLRLSGRLTIFSYKAEIESRLARHRLTRSWLDIDAQRLLSTWVGGHSRLASF